MPPDSPLERPFLRPIHLAECVAKGKHVFFEKPVAVDAPGIRSVLESARVAKQKGITFASGFCYRYDFAKRETIKRIHEGAVGAIRGLHVHDFRGPIWVKPRQPEWTDMEYHMRNWYYFVWICGDHIVEQHIHNLDVINWVKNGYPVRAQGMGGVQAVSRSLQGRSLSAP